MAIISSTTPWTVLQTVDSGIPKASAITLYDAPQASQYTATSTSTSWLHQWAFCLGQQGKQPGSQKKSHRLLACNWEAHDSPDNAVKRAGGGFRERLTSSHLARPINRLARTPPARELPGLPSDGHRERFDSAACLKRTGLPSLDMFGFEEKKPLRSQTLKETYEASE
ncbi:unnamed protein product [Gadus morhua 'NCC']